MFIVWEEIGWKMLQAMAKAERKWLLGLVGNNFKERKWIHRRDCTEYFFNYILHVLFAIFYIGDVGFLHKLCGDLYIGYYERGDVGTKLDY